MEFCTFGMVLNKVIKYSTAYKSYASTVFFSHLPQTGLASLGSLPPF